MESWKTCRSTLEDISHTGPRRYPDQARAPVLTELCETASRLPEEH